MQNDYSVFSKDELIEFLQKYEDRIRCTKSPFYVMCLWKRRQLLAKVNDNIAQSRKIAEDLKAGVDTREVSLMKFKENMEEYNSLYDELRKFEKLLFK